ncbi:FecR domain-containing protein [Xenophilus sp. Marseille-Q4582]|uniref:FecR family protein n=1 Tax=Xenophilus sp. Marseille-Q4582 TaxID=2866600 RepID=UPI001CE43AC0|nr:FecR domain-containing protein [Xenophilus sp. Marseille-Q4582]
MQAGVLKSVQGEVRLLRADGRTEIAQPGDGVSQVDRIQTGAHSGASLRLRDGTVLVVGPQSQLDLKQYQFNATTHDGNILLSLLQGSMRMVSGLIAKKQPEAVRIDTQTATIGIRGTDFIVSTDAHP